MSADIVDELNFYAQRAEADEKVLNLLSEAAGTIQRLRMPDAPTSPSQDAPEWLWYGEVNGVDVVTFGRWPKWGARWRYKLAEIQPTEHDHGQPKTARQAFEDVIAYLNYDGPNTDSLTVGEIRRALP